MITLHHLNQSRSFRILWLLEEIKEPYQLKCYYRDSTTHLAPESLKNIHPLGKSPVIEWQGKVIAESGAIVELLIQKLAPHLAPDINDTAYTDYLQWIHFAESSAMVPFLLKMFNAIEMKHGTKLAFLEDYAQVEFDKVFGFLNDYLKNKKFLVGDRLTGADFMMGFGLHGLVHNMGQGEHYPHIQSYVEHLALLPSWKAAEKIEKDSLILILRDKK
ncbi:glutathione S-transferase family protein [Acinetobacter sp. 1000160]|uniref:glutathione S-transferase family protein n=1 Tax=Acinetobacter sp. 1000160 TaxID=1310800 RepID=UPI0004507EB3|nr:glutathione S-transferase [Acinetobacter sp. 1000160]EXB47014.1 glutathione S-transferase, C-terminal domain protein [Acinetobacter baumannii 146457]EYT23775.1 glutathione S-transferase, C-terminal domain protein [Acinetobacter sp. 1000160]